MSIDTRHDIAGHPAWQAALAAAAVLGTLAAACMMPFVAVAVATAVTMSRARAAATIGIIWAVNQLLGFTLLGFPPTASAFAWGGALGAAALLAMLVARRLLGGRRALWRVPAAFGAAFLVYEGALFVFALVAGGTGTFTPAIIAAILANDATWLVGFIVLHAALTRTAPRWFGPHFALRSA